MLQVLDQADFPGPAVDDRQDCHARPLLEVGVLVEVVQHDLRLLAALELENDPHAAPVALVTDVANPFHLLVVDKVGGLLDEPGLVYLVGKLADDDRVAVLAPLLDRRPGPHHEVAASFLVGADHSGSAAEYAASRKIGPFYDIENALESRVRVLDQLDRGVDELAEVVGRDVRGHANGNAVRAVDQEVRGGGRQMFGLFRRIVVVRPVIHRIHFDVFQQRLRIRREARLGVAHRRRRIAIDRTEVALAGDQQLPHAERLGHAHKSVVDRGVAVRMVFTHHLADNAGAFPRRAVRAQALLAHGVNDAALHGLEAVPHVGESAANNDRHRVVEIRLAHLVLDVDRSNVGG